MIYSLLLRQIGFCTLLAIALGSMDAGSLHAQLLQQDKEPEPPPKNVPLYYPMSRLDSMSDEEIQQEIDSITPLFKESLKKMVSAKTRFDHGTKAQSHEYGKDWRDCTGEAQANFWKLKELVMAQYLRSERPDLDMGKLAGQMAFSAVEVGHYGTASRVLQKLFKQAPDLGGLNFETARLGLLTNDFKSAERIPLDEKLFKKLTRIEKALLISAEGLAEAWEQEVAIREKEEADDLPRVEIETTKGKIVVELFENEAPHTVGNFIHLVETGFYKNRFFHLVLRGFRAQGGVFSRDSVPKADYKIVNEGLAENARKAFRGSLAMTPMPDRASEFSIFTVPNPYESPEDPDVRITVFGRVIQGMDVVDALKVNARFKEGSEMIEQVNNRDGDMPDDFIVDAKVLRKRPGVEYKPRKVEKTD